MSGTIVRGGREVEYGDELLIVTAQDYEAELAEMLSPRGDGSDVSSSTRPL